MPESPIRKLAPYAEKAKLNGLKVYHLNIGQPDIKSPKIAIEAVKNVELDVLAYSKSEGNLELRKKIKDYSKRREKKTKIKRSAKITSFYTQSKKTN